MADLATAYVRLIPSLKGAEGTIKKELEGAVGSSEGKKSGGLFGDAFGSGFGDGLKGAMGGVAAAVGTAAKAVGTVAVAATGAAAAGMVAVGKQAYEAYGDFEQLAGGVETLFQDSAGTVMANAQNAFRTAGLSANDYMENVTSFSASLLQSLGGDTERAASYADRAIIDMSDNANKMGTNIQSIQDAYQGFAKQNYTMLDNLKLGYGGTQAEMQRLIADAAKMTDVQAELGVAVDESSLSFDNIVNAISVMQASMGIAGTTAKEATSTLQGSAGMMKASWQNLVTELGKPDADMGARMAEFASTVRTALLGSLNAETGEMEGGIIRIISQIAQNAAAALPGATEVIISTIGEVLPLIVDTVSQVAPQLIDALGQVIVALAAALPGIIVALVPVIISLVPHIVEAGIQLFLGLAQALYEAWPQISEALTSTILELASTIGSHGPEILAAAVELALMIAEGIVMAGVGILAVLVELLASLVSAVLEAAGPMFDAAGEFMAQMGDAINRGIESIKAWWTEKWNAVKAFTQNLWNAIKLLVQYAVSAVKSNISNTVSSIKSNWESAWNAVKTFAANVWNGIKSTISQCLSAVSSTITSGINSIKATWQSVWNAVKSFFTSIWSGIKSGATAGVNDVYGTVTGIKSKILGFFSGAASWLYSSGVSIMNGLKNGVLAAVGSVSSAISSAVSQVRNLFPFSPAKEGPFSGKGWVLYSGIAIMDALAEGAESRVGKTVAAYRGIADELQGTLGLDKAVSVSYANPARVQAAYGAAPAGQKGLTINIGEMNVRDRSDADYFAEALYRKISREEEGALWT